MHNVTESHGNNLTWKAFLAIAKKGLKSSSPEVADLCARASAQTLLVLQDDIPNDFRELVLPFLQVGSIRKLAMETDISWTPKDVELMRPMMAKIGAPEKSETAKEAARVRKAKGN
jgi:hypothetical protein